MNAIGWSGWLAPDRRADADALRLRERANASTYGAKLNLPPMRPSARPGFVEGTFGARVPAGRARRAARARPARAAPAQPRRHGPRWTGGRSRPRTWSSATGVPSRTGSGATRCAARSDETWKRGVGPREPDLVRRRRPALVRVGARRLRRPRDRRHRDAGHRHRHADGDGADRRRGARAAARPRRACELGDSARGPYASISAGSSTTPSMGPAVRAAAADAARQIVEIAAQRYDVEERVLSLEGRPGRLRRRRLVAARGDHRAARGRRRSSARARAARTRPGCACSPSAIQVAEVAVDVETGEVRVERIAAIHDVGRVINPLGAREPGRGRDHPGHRPHALRGAARRPARPGRC